MLISFSIKTSYAQVTVALNVDSHPSPQISEWVNRTNLAILTVTNTDERLEGTEYKIKVKLFLDGDLIAETNNSVAIQTLELGTQTFLADEIIPYSALEFHNRGYERQVMQTGMLPAGEYQFCVSLLDLNGEVISVPEIICQPMIITAYQMPELMMPIDDQEITSQLVPSIIFRWTPMTPMPSAEDGVKYIIAVSKVGDGQSPSQAFHVNYPIIEEEIMAGTQFIWPTDLDAPEETTQYVWSIKPVSFEDNPYKSGSNGFVDVETFIITRADDIELDDCACTDENQTQPELTITQPEPNNYPRKLELGNVTQLRDYLISCNNNLSITSHSIDVEIVWDEDHTDNLTNNGPFEHLYSIIDEIPEQVCVNVSIAPREGYNGGQCEKEFCINVPQSFQDLNIGDTPTGNIAVNDTIYAGQNGEFAIITTEINEVSNKYSGKGTAYIGWLKARMAVKFDSITVDVDRKLLTGIVLAEIYDAPAPVYPQDWALEVVSNNPMANNIAGNIVTWVENQTNQTIDYNSLTDYTDPVKLPLGVNFPSGDQLAITEMVFRQNKSEFNMVAVKTTPPSWGPEQLIGFEAKNLIFHPTQIVTPPERIELIEDVIIGNQNNDIFFTFKSPTGGNPGCYVEWNENGFSEYGIELNASFTRDWLVPVPDDGTSKSEANLIATGTDWNDLVLSGNLNKSEIMDAGESTGVVVMANTISYDMSDVLNPPNMEFPENYPPGAETTNLFRGFYMKTLSVEIGADGWETHSGGPPEISIQNMIINNSGITLYAEATNVYEFPNVGVADMAASIDTIHVDISGSSLVEAGIRGRIALPVSKSDSIQNPLEYNAIFHIAQNPAEHTNFQLTINPTGPINAHLMKGTMEFAETSNITAYIDKTKRTFQTTLNGNFVWDNVQLGPVKNINFNLGFQGIEFNYNSSLQNNKMQFNSGTWAFASPQKFMANFPVTIDNIGFEQLPTTGSQYLHGKLNFDVIFNLTEDIGGQTKLAVEVGVDENVGGTGAGKFKPQYIDTNIEDISIYAHLPAVSIDGTIQFRNDDPVFGNGFKGELTASFKAPKVGITALAEFGNTDYQYSSTYRYWRVEAAAKFTPGLPFLPGVAFYGFGGGAFKNMESTLVPASGSTPAAYTFSPKKGNLGFKVEATIGATPKVESFNADVGLNGQFSASQGMINIGFTGDFYVGAPLLPQTKRDEAQIKGNVIADYNFPDKHFFLGVNVDIDKAPAVVAMNQSLVLDINGKTNKWYFKFGEPTDTNNATIMGFNLYEYLMFGNDVHAPANGFTHGFREAYKSVVPSHGYPGIPSGTGVDSNSATGRGFALGVGFSIDKSVNKHIVNGYNIYLGINAGAEVNLSMMEYNGYNCANTSQRIGLNGWRARGNVGFYVDALAEVRKNNDVWPLANIKAGGWLDAKFPRPTYVAGAVEGNVQIGHWTTRSHSIVGDCTHGACNGARAHITKKFKNTGNAHRSYTLGWHYRTSCTHYNHHYLVNRAFNKSFDWGDNCGSSDSNTSPDSGPAMAQQDAANDQEQNLIKYVHAGPRYNYPATKPVTVKYGLPLDEVFDVTEQQSSGTVKTRTFKLVNTVTLYQKADGSNSYSTMMKNTDENNLGEYLYTKGQIQNMQAGPMNLTALQPMNSGNNTQAASNVQGMTLSGGMMQMNTQAQAMYTLYPAPTPPETSEYDNLPPEADPIVNTLEVNKTYKIVVTATLKEYVNNVWVNARKADNSFVTQTITKVFRTGPMVIVSASNNMAPAQMQRN